MTRFIFEFKMRTEKEENCTQMSYIHILIDSFCIIL